MWQPFRRLSSFRPWPPAEEEQKIIGSSKFLILVCVWHLSRVLGRSSSAQNCLLLSRWVINLLFCVCERVSRQSLCIMSDNINTWGDATLPSVGPTLSLNSRMPAQWPALKKRVLIVGSSHARRLDRFMGSENGKARPAVRPHFGVAAAEVRVYGRGGIPASRSHTADRWQWRPVNWRFGPHCAPASGSGRHIETPFRPGTCIYHTDPSQVH